MITPERLEELANQIAAMRVAPPAAGMGITLIADEVESLIGAGFGSEYAKLYDVNQMQASKIEALQAQAEQDAATIAEQAEKIDAVIRDRSAVIDERDEARAMVVECAAQIEKDAATIAELRVLTAPATEQV